MNLVPSLVPAIPALRKAGFGKTVAYQMLNDGVIPAVKIGVKTMVRPEDVASYVATLPSYLAAEAAVEASQIVQASA